MKQFTKNLWRLAHFRRTTGLTIACLLLLVVGWFQFSGESSDAEPAPTRKADKTIAGSSGSPRVAISYYELDEEQAGKIVRASATESSAETNSARSAADEPEDADASFRTMIVGEWEDDYQGKRSLTVAADGTGTMVVELDGIGKKLFAPRLSFDMEWNVADGHVSMKTLGGEPKSKVQLVLKLYGNEAQYKILELSADRMLLLDGDGKTRYDWRRPNSPRTSGTSGSGSS